MASVDQLLTSFGKLLVHILFDDFPMAVCLGFYGIHHYADPALCTVQGRIDTRRLSRVSPLAAPLFLEPSKVPVDGKGRERLAEDAARALLRAAGLD